MSVARPPDRYGAPRPWVRPVVVAAVAIVTLVGIVWLVWAAWIGAHPDVTSRLRGFEVIDDGTVSATIEVEREPGVRASCLILAQSADHSVVGEVTVEVPDSEDRLVTLTREISTERPATAVDLAECTAQR